MHHTSAPIDTHRLPSDTTALSFWQRLRGVLLHPLALVSAATLLALGLRLFRLDYRAYQVDEIISTLAARASLPEIYTSLPSYSIHPPFFFMLLHLWSYLGDDLATLRLLSVLISTACVPLLYLLGRTLHIGQTTTLLATAFLALSPFHIFHSQQARMYPLLVLMIIITTLLFYRAWRQGGWLSWAGLALSVGIGCHVHIYYPLSVIGLNVWALWESLHDRRLDRRQWLAILSAQTLGVALFLPFFPQMLGTTSSVVTSFWIRPMSPFYVVIALIGLCTFATSNYLESFPDRLGVFSAFAAGIMLMIVLVYSVRETRKNAAERSTWMLLQSMVWTPVLLALLISLTIKPILLERYLAGVTPFLFLLITWTVVRYWKLPLVHLFAIPFAVSIVATVPFIYPRERETSPLLEAARYLDSEQQPGDAIAYIHWPSFDATALVNPQQPDVFLVPGSSIWTSAEEWYDRMDFLNWHEPQNVGHVADFAPNYKRVWFVLTRPRFDLHYHQLISLSWLEGHGELVMEKTYKRGTIYLYELDDPPASP